MENNTPNIQVKINTYAKAPIGYRIISIVLFLASILSLFICACIVDAMITTDYNATDNMWIFFVFAIIPVSSVIYGFVIKKKGYKYKKNVITGIIMAVVMCIYGCFSFVFKGFYTDGLPTVSKVEQTIGIDIPDPVQASTQDMTKYNQTNKLEYTYYTCMAYFEENQVDEIQKQLSENENWIPKLPNDMFGIMSKMSLYNGSGYVLIYNCDTKEFNTLPEKDGKYHFINILYSIESNMMRIVEYDIEYTK